MRAIVTWLMLVAGLNAGAADLMPGAQAWLDAQQASKPLAESTKFATAGMRNGAMRNIAESKKIYKSMPAALRVLGTEADLNGLDASHIVPHSKGGSSNASNMVFESASKNRARGARVMTAKEVVAAKSSLRGRGFRVAARSCLVNAGLALASSYAITVMVSLIDGAITHGREFSLDNVLSTSVHEASLTTPIITAALGCALTVVAIPLNAPWLASATATLVVVGVAVLTVEIYKLLVHRLGYDPLAEAWGYVTEVGAEVVVGTTKFLGEGLVNSGKFLGGGLMFALGRIKDAGVAGYDALVVDGDRRLDKVLSGLRELMELDPEAYNRLAQKYGLPVVELGMSQTVSRPVEQPCCVPNPTPSP